MTPAMTMMRYMISVGRSMLCSIVLSLFLLVNIVDACCEHTCLDVLSFGAYGAFEVFLDDKASDGYAESCSVAGVFDVDAYGYLGIVVWGESDECAVVIAVGVLCRTCFAGDFDVGDGGAVACSAGDGCSHALCNSQVVPCIDGGTAFFEQLGVDDGIGGGFDDMRGDEVASVGDGGAEVGYLYGGGANLALSDGYGDDGVGTPVSFAVNFVVETVVGNESAAFAGEVDAEAVSVAHADEVLLPSFEGVGVGAVAASAVNHCFESVAEVCVARSGECRNERQGASVSVATYVKTSADISVVAGVCCAGCDDAFLE